MKNHAERLSRLWESVVNLGVRPETDADTAKAVRITNRLSAIIATLTLLAAPVDAATGVPFMVLYDLGQATIFSVILLLNRAERTRTARYAFLLVCLLAVFLNLCIYGDASGMHLLCFVAVCWPPILLLEKEWKAMVLCSMLSAAIFVAFQAGWIERWTSLPVNASGLESVYWYSVGATFLLLFVFVFYLQRENRRSEAKIREQQAKLIDSEKMSSLGRMAGGVAHEINTPLATLLMQSQYISDIAQDESFDRELLTTVGASIGKTVQQISRIVSGLTLVARVGNQDPVARIALAPLLAEAAVFWREKFAEQHVELELPPSPPAEGLCRQAGTVQIILNLISNSYDAVIQREGKRWIRMDIRDGGEMWELGVTDNGTGVPEEIRGKIFDPFFTTKDFGKGTGLGLSSARGLAQSQGGDALLDPVSPQTRFVLKIPKAPKLP